MILVVEAGATSTRWRAIGADGRVAKAHTGGVNVATIARAVVEERVAKAVAELNPAGERLERVHFYAAGMLSDEVASLFPGTREECDSDLLAAARAVCHHEPGIAAILGLYVEAFFQAICRLPEILQMYTGSLMETGLSSAGISELNLTEEETAELIQLLTQQAP